MTTNHPAPAEPVDLDALLSPAGPYETGPDAGNADGAQLVRDRHGIPTWWAPVCGCDSLDGLLDQIRSRILPHLRPPVLGIDIPGPDGDWADIADLCQAEGVEVEAGARLLRRARAAWHPAWYQAQPTPPAEGELADLAGSVEARATWLDEGTPEERLLRRVAYVLRQRQAPPHEGEVDALIKILSRIAGILDFMPDGFPDGLVIHRAIELLRSRQPTPPAEEEVKELAALRRQVAPVPVSERPWTNNAGWLDPDGECWWCPPDGPAYWSMANPAMVYGGWLLPAHAIPVPPKNRPNG